jgi:hypothetical protein
MKKHTITCYLIVRGETLTPQLDPTGQSQSYVYANDNPVNFVDPTGKFSLGQFAEDVGIGCGEGVIATGSILGEQLIFGAAIAPGAFFAAVGGSCLVGAATGAFAYYVNGANAGYGLPEVEQRFKTY